MNQALINAIADGDNNTALEARTAWNGLLNELYPSVYRTAWNAEFKTVQLDVRFRYDFIFSKSGNKVTMFGSFYSSVGTISANSECFSFTDSEYANLNNGINILNATVELGGVPFLITNGVFECLESFTGTTPKYFQLTYFTND